MTQALNLANLANSINSSGQLAGSAVNGAVASATNATNATNLTGGTCTIGTTQLGAGNASIMKNRIINGAMVIDQRNAGASVSTTTINASIYTVDRWFYQCGTASKFTVQQNAGSVTPPVGFSKYLGCTSTSAYSLTSSDYFGVSQKIEGYNFADLGWGTANAKTVTLSFQVYSSLTGTFGGSILNSSVNRSYPFTYTVSSANTWTTISVTIAGDTTGTWTGATNDTACFVWFSLGAGSSNSGTANTWAGATYFAPTGATSVVGTSGATFYITGVQLEVGSSATGFEYVNYQTSLANCQRYYQTIAGYLTPSNYASGAVATRSGGLTYPVTMRANPTVAFSSISYVNSSALNIDQNAVWGFSTYATAGGAGGFSITFTSTSSAEL